MCQLLETLTPAEREVITELLKGKLYKELAEQQSVSLDTIKKHAKNIYKKLEVGNLTSAMALIYTPT